MKPKQLRVGMRVRFTPSAWLEKNTGEQSRTFGNVPLEVVGKIVQINRAHRWFLVRYEVGRYTGHETFKF